MTRRLGVALSLALAGCAAAPREAAKAPPSACPADAELCPEATVQAQLEAYNRGDIAAFIATFHPDAELFVLGEDEPKARGRPAIEAIYADLFARSPNLHSEVVHRAVIGDRVVDHERITGRDGSDAPLELIMVYEVEPLGIRRAWAIRP